LPDRFSSDSLLFQTTDSSWKKRKPENFIHA
jgi:hypothetical protein